MGRKWNNHPVQQLAGFQNGAELAEAILFKFSDGRGVWKATYAKRFGSFDATVCELVKTHLGAGPLVVHDLAVSDARTAVDFYQSLQRNRIDARFYASDPDIELVVLVTVTNNWCLVAMQGFGVCLAAVCR